MTARCLTGLDSFRPIALSDSYSVALPAAKRRLDALLSSDDCGRA
jgi:hypothetical protein